MHTLNPFVCGTFHNEYEEACSDFYSPKKYKRKDSKNNPYSTRGLDKFSELLADLDERRQKVYSETNPHDISFVRFVYSNTDDIVPVVVKVKKNSNKNKDQKHKSQQLKVVIDKSSITNQEERKQQHKIESEGKVAKMSNFPWDIGKPYFYLPAVIIMILWLLTQHGRIYTIFCTCVFWFMISIIRGRPYPNPRKSMNKGYVRGLSEKNIVSNEGAKKKEYTRALSESKINVTRNEGAKKKNFVRALSEKFRIGEGSKKKDNVRGGSEKKMDTEGSSSSSPRSGADSEGSKKNKKNKKKGSKQLSHKKTW